MMVLFEVVIPKRALKFGAKNFNFIRIRLGYVMFNFYVICTTNEHDNCDQHLK